MIEILIIFSTNNFIHLVTIDFIRRLGRGAVYTGFIQNEDVAKSVGLMFELVSVGGINRGKRTRTTC